MAEWELFATSNRRSITGGNYFYSEIKPIIRLEEYLGFAIRYKEINAPTEGSIAAYLMTNSTVPTENDVIANLDFFNYEYKFNLEVTRMSGGVEVRIFQSDYSFRDVTEYNNLGIIFENTNSGYTYSYVTAITVKLYRKKKSTSFTKINGSVKRLNKIVARVNGNLVNITGVYTKVNGEVKRLL